MMITPLPLAIRVYPLPEGYERFRHRGLARWRQPRTWLVLDTETRTDAAQALTFGSYRFIEDRRCVEEGIFYADDLPGNDRSVLQYYVATHPAHTDRKTGNPRLLLLSRTDFLERFYSAAFDARSLVVGFNLPFDLSRLACGFGTARGRFAGGFSHILWEYVNECGERREYKHRPRIAIKHIDSKRALIGFTSARDPDPIDLLADEAVLTPGKKQPFRGNFLELRRLAFVLTDRGMTLAGACKAFGVEHGKLTVERHGIVTGDYIDYNRRDVEASAELAEKMLEEYARFDVSLQVTKAYSPASLGKAHLRQMRIAPILERQRFPKRYLGHAQSAFYGGRTSAHIRKVPVPVVYTDFLSMYPTVNALMGLWQYAIAEKIEVVPERAAEIETFLQSVSLDTLFDPAIWRQLPAFVRMVPNGDILPTRARYSRESNDWQVAVDHLRAAGNGDALWFALPDIVASVLLTGRIPKILDAFRIVPEGKLWNLKPITLRGAVEIDPRTQDFFKTVIEERKCLAQSEAIPDEERKRLDKALKVLANATSYGIFAEMNRQESAEKVNVRCYGIDATSYDCRVLNPEAPGEYCFPPLAALITSAARLMLALLERCVSDAGGTYAMEDTDSMAIVATKRGGLVPCPGGPYRMKGGREAIRALSWEQVREIAELFARLNPYDREAVRGSILKIEDDNFVDPETRKQQRQLWCYAISAKRYTLFVRDRRGEPALLRKDENNAEDRWSEHGLGHLLNPIDPQSEDRSWIAHAWLAMVRRSLGLATKPLGLEKRAAVGRISVSSPAALKPLQALNQGREYRAQIKPFNFILAAQVRKLGHPPGVDPQRFHLISQYETDPRRWEQLHWIDQYSGKRHRIRASGLHGARGVARVRNYGEVLREYEFHPEAKCADAMGEVCGKQSIGLLSRRHVAIESIRYIGKESNRLEEVEEQSILDPSDVYVEYPDPRRERIAWLRNVVPKLRATPLKELQSRTGLSLATLKAMRAGRMPHARNRARVLAVIQARRLP